ncbi:TetR family transcriptional regulator [Nocardioides sp. Soil797]|nr:TetR family transcriptional regulator [Nocardioides sp. Soil797]
MPRNRRPQDREEKRAEIVVAATTLFTDSGYDETSMSKVATAAGVTTNTIYWYFDDKDALLVAVLDYVLEAALADAALEPERPWGEQILWAVDRLDQYRRLVTVVHAKTATSPVVEAWHNGFHTLVDTLLVDGFRRVGIPESDLVPMAAIGTFVVEGLLMHPHAVKDRRVIVQTLVASRP